MTRSVDEVGGDQASEQVDLAINSAVGDLDVIGYDVAGRLSRSHVLPLVLILVLLLFFLAFKYIVYSNTRRLCRWICGCTKDRSEEAEQFGYDQRDQETRAREEQAASQQGSDGAPPPTNEDHALPNYWDALPTEVLMEVARNMRAAKDAYSKRKMLEAYQKRRAMHDRRQNALRQLANAKQASLQLNQQAQQARQLAQVARTTEAQVQQENQRRVQMHQA